MIVSVGRIENASKVGCANREVSGVLLVRELKSLSAPTYVEHHHLLRDSRTVPGLDHLIALALALGTEIARTGDAPTLAD
jgi:hypothetical protein